ncbi:MAG TPA: hypothetical protein VG328_11425 [Stellaceae bacterium]|nr:hypothetical protein [Stellaceae bacterium]
MRRADDEERSMITRTNSRVFRARLCRTGLQSRLRREGRKLAGRRSWDDEPRSLDRTVLDDLRALQHEAALAPGQLAAKALQANEARDLSSRRICKARTRASPSISPAKVSLIRTSSKRGLAVSSKALASAL